MKPTLPSRPSRGPTKPGNASHEGREVDLEIAARIVAGHAQPMRFKIPAPGWIGFVAASLLSGAAWATW